MDIPWEQLEASRDVASKGMATVFLEILETSHGSFWEQLEASRDVASKGMATVFLEILETSHGSFYYFRGSSGSMEASTCFNDETKPVSYTHLTLPTKA